MTKTKRYSAREMIQRPRDELWSLPDGPMEIEMDDGVVETTLRRTLYCLYIWQIHYHYPDTPLLTQHHLGMGRISGKSHQKLLTEVYRSWFEAYHGRDGINDDDCWKLIYEIVNDIYNDGIQRLDRYVSTLSILDFYQVVNHPEIKQANDTVVPTQVKIDETYDTIERVLKNDTSLYNNGVADAVRSGLVDIAQVNQCVGPRGFITEIDSTIFKEPVTVGYGHGMRSLYDSMIESRSAAKALLFAKDPLSKCEYFNRKLQLVGQVVETLYRGDCGSQYLMPWTIESNELEHMEGIHYVDNGEVKTIRASNKSLIGHTLNLRTPFGCTHPDRQTVCEVCYGEMAHSIPEQTVPGHVAGIVIGEKTSQLVLSTKHVDGSSKVDDIDLGEFYSQYLVPGAENNTLRLNPELKGLPIEIVIDSDAIKSLPDIYNIDDLMSVDVTQITEMRDLTLRIGREDDEGGIHEMQVPVSMGSRFGSLTPMALSHLRSQEHYVDEAGNYHVSLDGWDSAQSLVQLPLKHMNMLDFQAQVESMIMSSDSKSAAKSGLARYRDPVDAIKALLGLITTKLNINLSHVITIAYAVSAVDPKIYDYRLPRGGESFHFCKLKQLMQHRSMGAMMAYQEHADALYSFESYVVKQRLRHPMDPLLMGY